MELKESFFDQNVIKHFYSDVLHHLLPNARHQSINYIGSAETEIPSNAQIDIADSNEINIGSPYFYDKKYEFIHYTTLQALINILRTKKLRLYDLQGMDDKLEFTVPVLKTNKSLSDFEIDEAKKKIFCMSMCETRLEKSGDSLPAWREYGDKGNGVGIVLSFNKNYANEWLYFMLSKVYYSNTAIRKFKALDLLYNVFKEKYKFTVNNFDSLMYKYFAFHKHKIYRTENEVRLLYCQGLSYIDRPPVHHDLNKRNELTTYIELDLEWDWDSKTKDILTKKGLTPIMLRPVISITKIILGYRITNKAKYKISEVIQKLTADFETLPEITDSNLMSQF